MDPTDSKYIHSPHADGTLAGDRAAIYHRETRKAVTLNPVGTLLWQALDQPHSEAELVAILISNFADVPAETLAIDVANFVQQMLSHNLIVAAY